MLLTVLIFLGKYTALDFFSFPCFSANRFCMCMQTVPKHILSNIYILFGLTFLSMAGFTTLFLVLN